MSEKDLEHFFISHLNRIYCAKSQLADKLPELGKRTTFLDLRQAIDETVELDEAFQSIGQASSPMRILLNYYGNALMRPKKIKYCSWNH